MRGSVLLFLVGLTLPVPAALHAQGEFGVKGGVTFGNISNKGVLPGNLKTRTGFAGGLYAGMRFTAVGIGIEGLVTAPGVATGTALIFVDREGHNQIGVAPGANHRLTVEMARVLTTGGRLAILEFSMPQTPVISHVYRWYFRHVLPRIGRLVSHHEEAYTYLPESVGVWATP